MLKLLYQLQKLEDRQRACEAEKQNTDEYRRLLEIKAEFDEDKQQWGKLAALREELLGNRNLYATELETIAQKIAKEREAIYDGTTSTVKALSARESQVAVLAAKQNELTTLDQQADSKLHQIEEKALVLKEKIEQEFAEFEKLKADYQRVKRDFEQQELDTASKIAALLPTIDPKTLLWFNDNKDRFAGSPVALLSTEHVCEGCRTIVTPVLYKRTVMGQQTYCEKCGRALFIDFDF